MAYPYTYPYQSGSYNQPQYAQPMAAQQFSQLPQINPPIQSGMVCRPVASKEEAAQTQIPFDGNPYVFINQMAGEIYTKQFNTLNGNTEFTTFTKSAPERTERFATRDELDALKAEFEKIRRPGRKREVVEDE